MHESLRINNCLKLGVVEHLGVFVTMVFDKGVAEMLEAVAQVIIVIKKLKQKKNNLDEKK